MTEASTHPRATIVTAIIGATATIVVAFIGLKKPTDREIITSEQYKTLVLESADYRAKVGELSPLKEKFKELNVRFLSLQSERDSLTRELALAKESNEGLQAKIEALQKKHAESLESFSTAESKATLPTASTAIDRLDRTRKQSQQTVGDLLNNTENQFADFKPVVKRLHGFVFTLYGCSRDTSSVICNLDIESTDFDRTVWWCGNSNQMFCGGDFRSVSYDNAGNKYMPSQISIANMSSGGDFQNKLILAGIKHNSTIKFDNMSQSATGFSRLYLSFVNGSTYDNKGKFNVEFRAIEFVN